MLDSRNSSGCGFEKEIVAYVYSDMNSEDRRVFETHLDRCTSCLAEIDAFSSVSLAIAEWKASSFDQLETPAIAVTSEQIDRDNVVIPEGGTSIVGKLGDWFGFGPGMWQTATAFGAILLAVGILWFAFGNRMTEKEMAVVPPVVEKTDNPAPAQDISDDEKTLAPNKDEIEQYVQETTISNKIPDLTPVKTVVRKTPSRINSNAVTEKRIEAPKSTKEVPVNTSEPLPVVPRLTQLAEVDDTEDTGLRLADLFAGSGSEER